MRVLASDHDIVDAEGAQALVEIGAVEGAVYTLRAENLALRAPDRLDDACPGAPAIANPTATAQRAVIRLRFASSDSVSRKAGRRTKRADPVATMRAISLTSSRPGSSALVKNSTFRKDPTIGSREFEWDRGGDDAGLVAERAAEAPADLVVERALPEVLDE
jgi:hypothetical protein